MQKLLLVTSFVLLGFLAQAQSFRIASFNIRYDNKRDSGNLWQDRAPYVAELIRFHDFDVFGTQEGLKNQLEDIQQALPQYSRYGKGRDDGKEKGEHSVIFYKKDKFQLLRSGDFWLSETPDVPGKGWDATCCNRIVSWVQLLDKKSGKRFYVFNAHYDHQGETARKESSQLLLSKIKTIAGSSPVIVTGDFNADRDSEPYKILAESGMLHDSYNDVKYPYENNSTFNNFGRNITDNVVIDHIFATKQVKASQWAILTDTYLGKYPSDHFPVLAVVSW